MKKQDASRIRDEEEKEKEAKRFDKIEAQLKDCVKKTPEKIHIPKLDGEEHDFVPEAGEYAVARRSKSTLITKERAIKLAENAVRKYPSETFAVIKLIAEYKIGVDVMSVEE